MNRKYRTVYKTEKHKKELYQLYDKVLNNWPIPFKELNLETRCGKTHIIQCGNKSGKPLFLFHGTGNNSLMWRYNVKELGSLFNLFLVDTINDPGKSTASIDFNPATDYARWVTEILNELEIHTIFCIGHSKGGWIALNSTITTPEIINKTVLLSPAAGINSKLQTKFLFKSILVGISPSVKNLTSYFHYISGPEKSVNTNYMEYLAKVIKGTISKPVKHRKFSDEELKSIHKPVLIVFGDHEVSVDYKIIILRAEQCIPGVKTEIIPNAGHGLQGEYPELVNTMISTFLST